MKRVEFSVIYLPIYYIHMIKQPSPSIFLFQIVFSQKCWRIFSLSSFFSRFFSKFEEIRRVKVNFIDFSRSNRSVFFCFCWKVCVKTIEKFAETLTDDEKKNPSKIEENLKKFCSKVRVDSKEDRLVSFSQLVLDFSHWKKICWKKCYYIGASKTSATYAIGDFSKPLSWGIPIEKICRERLAKTNPQICELKFGQSNEDENENENVSNF